MYEISLQVDPRNTDLRITQSAAYHFIRYEGSQSNTVHVVKMLCLQVLVELVNDENVEILLDELKGYCTDVNTDTAQAAISALGKETLYDLCIRSMTMHSISLMQDKHFDQQQRSVFYTLYSS